MSTPPQSVHPIQKIEYYKGLVPAILALAAAIASPIITGHFASNMAATTERLVKPEAQIVWPMDRSAQPCEPIIGWSKNIPADEQLIIVLPTAEENNLKTYNYPVAPDRTNEQWRTIQPVFMATEGAEYTIYLYSLKDKDRTVHLGHTGVPVGSALDHVRVKRSQSPPPSNGFCKPF